MLKCLSHYYNYLFKFWVFASSFLLEFVDCYSDNFYKKIKLLLLSSFRIFLTFKIFFSHFYFYL